MWEYEILKCATTPLSELNFVIPQKFFRILNWLGLNFNVNNLKFVQMVGFIVVYIFWKFHIDSLQIKISTNVFIPQKLFCNLIEICNIEMRNRLLTRRRFSLQRAFDWCIAIPTPFNIMIEYKTAHFSSYKMRQKPGHYINNCLISVHNIRLMRLWSFAKNWANKVMLQLANPHPADREPLR